MRKVLIMISLVLAVGILSGCFGAGRSEYRSLSEIRRSGVLNIYVNPSGRPFAYEREDAHGIPAGSEVELMEELAHRLGVEAVFVIAETADIYAAVRNGAADIAVGMLIDTASARSGYMFTASTGSQGLYAVAAVGEMPNTVGTFEDRRVGVVSGAASEYGLIISPVRPSETLYYENIDYGIAALLNGECDIFVCSEYEAALAVAQYDTLTAEYVVNAAMMEFSAMVARGNDALLEEANDAILGARGG